MASADDAKMSETPVPETLDTIAAKIGELSASIDRRFEDSGETIAGIAAKVDALSTSIDRRFEASAETVAEKIDALRKSTDQRFDEVESRLGVKIEAVDTKVALVLEAVTALQKGAETNAKDPQPSTERG